MLAIRLKRVGRKHDPSYRIIVTDNRKGPKSGNYIESIGVYNPHVDERRVDIERAKHWLSVGAQPSDTVHNIFVTEGVIDGKKKNVLPKKSPIISEQEAVQDAATAETPETTESVDVPDQTAEDTTQETPVEAPAEEVPTEEIPQEPAEEQSTEEKEEVPTEEQSKE